MLTGNRNRKLILPTELPIELLRSQWMPFKDTRIEQEWNSPSLDPKVRQIVSEAMEHAENNLDWSFYFTSIYRTEIEDQALGGSGVHT